MSRYYDDYVEHSWGTDPKQKAKRKRTMPPTMLSTKPRF